MQMQTSDVILVNKVVPESHTGAKKFKTLLHEY